MPRLSPETAERLQHELSMHERELRDWVERCSINAMWYITDPVGAMRSANIGFDESLLRELETLEAAHQTRHRRRKEQGAA